MIVNKYNAVCVSNSEGMNCLNTAETLIKSVKFQTQTWLTLTLIIAVMNTLIRVLIIF